MRMYAFALLVLALAATPFYAPLTPLAAQDGGDQKPDEGKPDEGKPDEGKGDGQPPPAAQPPAPSVAEFEAQMKTADEAGKVKLLESMATSTDPEAAKAVSKFMTDRSLAVKCAAIKTVGLMKDKASYGKLVAMLKTEEKEPKALAAVVKAIGEYGEAKSQKNLIDLAKKWLAKDSEVASAAAYGLGKIPSRDCVEELIKLLALTNPKQGQSGTSVSSETRDLMAKSKPAIISALQELTGWDFRDAPAWERFWKIEEKTWKPGSKNPDLTTIEQWKDPGYGFSIDKPGDKWFFDRSVKEYRIILKIGGQETGVQAQIYIMAYENTNGFTAAQKAEEYMTSFKTSWKDIKPESIVEDKSYKVGKEKGFMQAFTGKDAYGTIAKSKNIYVTVGDMMFIVGSWSRSGIPEEMVTQLEKALSSFSSSSRRHRVGARYTFVTPCAPTTPPRCEDLTDGDRRPAARTRHRPAPRPRNRPGITSRGSARGTSCSPPARSR